MAAFVLAKIVNNYQHGQEATLTGNLIAICLEQLNDPHHLLRQWLALCLGKVRFCVCGYSVLTCGYAGVDLL